jgi:hypothetical protein
MTSLTSVRLHDGTQVACVRRLEARVLDAHVDGYLRHGIDVGPGAIVVDAGANIGLFGVRVLGRCGGDATILAFEPVPPTFAALAENAARYDASRFKAFRCGLGSRAGGAELTYYPRSPAMSTAHPEIYDEEPDLLPRGVAGSVRHAPAGMRWARLLPAPICRFIAWRLRLDAVRALLRRSGLDRQHVDQEDAFRGVPLYNVYAARTS